MKKFIANMIDTTKIRIEVIKSSSLKSLKNEIIKSVTQKPIKGFNTNIAIGGINALINIPINNHITINKNRRYLFFLSFDIPLMLKVLTQLSYLIIK